MLFFIPYSFEVFPSVSGWKIHPPVLNDEGVNKNVI